MSSKVPLLADRPEQCGHPQRHLKGFKGILQADAYAGFKELYKPDATGNIPVREAACWAHLRRDFHDVWLTTKSEIAKQALDRIGELYDIEKQINGRSAPERQRVRQEHTKSKVDAFRSWVEQQLACLSGKSDLAKAFRYFLNRWAAFTLFLADGRVAIDNNVAERAIRPVAMGESLCTPSSSICKHWKRARIDNPTRATFLGQRRFHRLRCQVVDPDLMRSARNNLHGLKDAGFYKASYRMVCDA